MGSCLGKWIVQVRSNSPCATHTCIILIRSHHSDSGPFYYVNCTFSVCVLQPADTSRLYLPALLPFILAQQARE